MIPRRLAELERSEQRRAILRSLVRIGVTISLLIGGYFFLPIRERSSGGMLVWIGMAIIVCATVLVWQLRRIVNADLPELRAIEAASIAIPMFLVLFATTYILLVRLDPAAFSETLNKMGAFYFTITVFATVGFGDIAPKSDTARLLVTTQMIGDLVAIGVILRLLMRAARAGLGRTGAPPNDEGPAVSPSS